MYFLIICFCHFQKDKLNEKKIKFCKGIYNNDKTVVSQSCIQQSQLRLKRKNGHIIHVTIYFHHMLRETPQKAIKIKSDSYNPETDTILNKS